MARGLFGRANSPDLEAMLRRTLVTAAPDLSVTSMVPLPFENPLPDKINLPAPLAELARELSPIMAKLMGFVLLAAPACLATGPCGL